MAEESETPDGLRTAKKIAGAIAVVVIVPMLLHKWMDLPPSVVAETHRLEGRYDQAIDEFTAIIKQYPGLAATAPDYNRRGQSYQGKGDLDRALADFDEAIRLRPDFPDAFFNRCDARRRKGDIDRALADCGEAARLKPDDLEPRGLAVRMLFGRGDIDAARAKIDDAIALQERAESTAINYRFYRGQIALFHDNRPAEAAEDFVATLKKAFDYRLTGSMFGSQEVDGVWVNDLMGYRHPFVPDAYYTVLWLRIARVRAGQNYALELAENVEQLGAPIRRTLLLEAPRNISDEVLAATLRPWAGRLIALFLGKVTPESIRALAEATENPDIRRRRVCDVDFYAGLYALEKGADARKLLQAAADGCPAPQAGFAKAELKRLPASTSN